MFTNALSTPSLPHQTHFITGSTGFIGSSIVLELLMHTNDDIYCLVRRSKNKSAHQRFMDLITDLIEKFNYQNLIAISDLQRCKIVEGDLFSSFDVIKNQVLVEVDHFWHVAASLNYDEKYKEDIYHTNITGSKTILELAFQLNTKKFNHFSTAYVVGKKTGEILETVVESSESNNIYEQSKLAAEKIILAEKEKAFEKDKEMIKFLLQSEIVTRYYFQKGRIINSLNRDPYIFKAKEILNNSNEYNKILGK